MLSQEWLDATREWYNNDPLRKEETKGLSMRIWWVCMGWHGRDLLITWKWRQALPPLLPRWAVPTVALCSWTTSGTQVISPQASPVADAIGTARAIVSAARVSPPRRAKFKRIMLHLSQFV